MGVGDNDEPPRSTRKCCLPQTKQNKLRSENQENDSINQITIKSHKGTPYRVRKGAFHWKSWYASHGEGVVDAKLCWRISGVLSYSIIILYFVVFFFPFCFRSVLFF